MTLSGAVQGVGFRPFVYRLATELGLAGWVLNSSAGLVVEVEGPSGQLSRFLERIESEKPAAAVVLAREVSYLAPAGFTGFEIRASDEAAEKTTSLLPDLATCPACLAELRDPANRRFEYPFTNCTNCGPRYSIILDIPYDRPRTTMHSFRLCPECHREYTDPLDRRFHAQPNACPVCGPRLSTEPRPLGSESGTLRACCRKAFPLSPTQACPPIFSQARPRAAAPSPSPPPPFAPARSWRSRASGASNFWWTLATRTPLSACATSSTARKNHSRS